LDGDDAAAVDDDAHGCERHERERDENEQELGSEVHGSQPARSIPTGGKYNVKRLDCGITNGRGGGQTGGLGEGNCVIKYLPVSYLPVSSSLPLRPLIFPQSVFDDG